MVLCDICGLENKTTIRCSRCSQQVCLNCFWCSLALCADCLVMEYNEKYKEKIEAYEFAEGLSIGG